MRETKKPLPKRRKKFPRVMIIVRMQLRKRMPRLRKLVLLRNLQSLLAARMAMMKLAQPIISIRLAKDADLIGQTTFPQTSKDLTASGRGDAGARPRMEAAAEESTPTRRGASVRQLDTWNSNLQNAIKENNEKHFGQDQPDDL